MTYLANSGRIGQSGRSREKRCKGDGLKFCKAEWVVDECIDDSTIAAQPIEWGTRGLEGAFRMFSLPLLTLPDARVRLIIPGNAAQSDHVLYQQVKAALAEISEICFRWCSAAVSR